MFGKKTLPVILEACLTICSPDPHCWFNSGVVTALVKALILLVALQ